MGLMQVQTQISVPAAGRPYQLLVEMESLARQFRARLERFKELDVRDTRARLEYNGVRLNITLSGEMT